MARDLGQALGRTGVIDEPRGDIVAFEQSPFIRGIKNGHVQFDYRGRHKVLFETISPADVRWACYLLSHLTREQWQDAFRAGGYQPAAAERFIRRIQEKIASGLELGETTLR